MILYGIVTIVLMIALTDLCDTVSQIALKHAVNSLNANLDSVGKVIRFVCALITKPLVWLGFTFSVMSLSIWLFVLSKADLNLAFSLDSMRYIMITFASMFFLKEKITLKRWMGIACVVIGIALVAAG